VGAYTAAYLATKLGMSPWLTLLVGSPSAVAVALLLGWITLRMSGHYLPLATIAWGLALYYTMGNMDAWASTTAFWVCPRSTVRPGLNDGRAFLLSGPGAGAALAFALLTCWTRAPGAPSAH
jgi:branched-chain amino acid transport system permease protein